MPKLLPASIPPVMILIAILSTACSSQDRIESPLPRQGASHQGEGDAFEGDDGNPWHTDRKGKDSIQEKPSPTDGTETPGPGTQEEPSESPAPDEGDDGGDQETPGNEVRASGGSGGRTGLVEESFTASNGERSTYKINAPEDAGPGKPYGLHIHLHGDGGGGYRDFPNREPAHGLIGVTVKAPNRNLQWGRREGAAHGQYLQELIQDELLKKYNVDLDRIYFSGVSGGSYFLTGSFIPSYGHHYNSGAFIMCGGEPPRVDVAEPGMLKKFRIYWQVTAGERRDIMTSVEASIRAYDQLLVQELDGDTGFDKKTVQDQEITGQGGHCEFDGQPYTPGIQSMMNRKFEVVLRD